MSTCNQPPCPQPDGPLSARDALPWLDPTSSKNPIDAIFINYVLLLFLCPIWPAHGSTSASWSFGPSLLVCLSPLLVLCAQTSQLTFTIAYRPPRRTQHLHIHKPRDTSHNVNRYGISLIKHISNMNSNESLKPLNSCVNHLSHLDKTKTLLNLVS